MSLLDDLKQQSNDAEKLVEELNLRRSLLSDGISRALEHAHDLAIAIAALSPAPEGESAGEVEVPEALAEFMKREGAELLGDDLELSAEDLAVYELLFSDGVVRALTGAAYFDLCLEAEDAAFPVRAYRILSPAPVIDGEPDAEAKAREVLDATLSAVMPVSLSPDTAAMQANVYGDNVAVREISASEYYAPPEADQVTQANAAIAQTTDELAAEPPHNFDADVFAAGIEAEAEPKHKFSIFGIRYKLPTEKEPA